VTVLVRTSDFGMEFYARSPLWQYWFVLQTLVWSFTHVALCDSIGSYFRLWYGVLRT